MNRKIRIGLLITLILFIGSAVMFAGGDEVNWVDKYDQAFAEARRQNKNVFVLITAPSWCYWCQVLEENVLNQSDIIQSINEGYVPLLVMDEVDGRQNPDLRKFDFDGYPSVFVFDKDKKFVADVYTQDAATMRNYLASYSEGGGEPAVNSGQASMDYLYTERGGGHFLRNGDGTWSDLSDSGRKYTYEETDKDEEYVYLFDGDREMWVALPLEGGVAYYGKGQGDEWGGWKELFEVTPQGSQRSWSPGLKKP